LDLPWVTLAGAAPHNGRRTIATFAEGHVATTVMVINMPKTHGATEPLMATAVRHLLQAERGGSRESGSACG